MYEKLYNSNSKDIIHNASLVLNRLFDKYRRLLGQVYELFNWILVAPIA